MHFDIFCRVIDNFGDVGVCWRLARQLTDLSPQHRVTLWVDDLARFQRLEPRVTQEPIQALTSRITVIHWTDNTPRREPGDVVIEAFSCDPPASFIRDMVARGSLWINLEYLSAESWVEGCHKLPSLQANGLKKFFFFPGFTPKTGGLLREDGLLQERSRWQQQPAQRDALLTRAGVPESWIQKLYGRARLALLFGYPNAPVTALTGALAASQTPWILMVPEGTQPGLVSKTTGHLKIVEIPFVSQDEFDRLLWSADLNFVRGEDSLVRALWAGRPMIWQIYEQSDDTHLIKLKAWLEKSPYPPEVHQLMMHWNTGDGDQAEKQLHILLDGPKWPAWQSYASQWADQLANQPSLVSNLHLFCTENR